MHFYHLAYQLKRSEHALAQALEKAVRPFGVTLTQVNVLLFVDRFPGATVTQLADIAAVTTPTMHRIIVTLQGKGLLDRMPKPGDDKSLLTTPTPAGKQVLEVTQLEIMHVQEQAKTALKADDLEELYRLLRLYEGVFSEKRNKHKGETHDTN